MPAPRPSRRLRCRTDESRAGLLADPAHLADELEIDPELIQESTRFREDLEADSLDLYTLVQELEDSYGVKISDEEAARILTVGQAVEFVLASDQRRHEPVWRPRAKAPTLSDAQTSKARDAASDALPQTLLRGRRCSRTRRGPTRRSDSYERLAFLGDSVLGLAVTTHLFPRLEADRFGPGRLTKIRAQAVSGRSCRAVAERLGVPERLRGRRAAGGGGRASRR